MIELTTEEPQKNKTHKWHLYWFHASDLDANYPADEKTLASAGYHPVSHVRAWDQRAIVTALLASPELREQVLDQIVPPGASGLCSAHQQPCHQCYSGLKSRAVAAETHLAKIAQLAEATGKLVVEYITPSRPGEQALRNNAGYLLAAVTAWRMEAGNTDMATGTPTHRDARNWATRTHAHGDIGHVAFSQLLRYIDQQKQSESDAAEEIERYRTVLKERDDHLCQAVAKRDAAIAENARLSVELGQVKADARLEPSSTPPKQMLVAATEVIKTWKEVGLYPEGSVGIEEHSAAVEALCHALEDAAPDASSAKPTESFLSLWEEGRSILAGKGHYDDLTRHGVAIRYLFDAVKVLTTEFKSARELAGALRVAGRMLTDGQTGTPTGDAFFAAARELDGSK